MNYLKKLVHIKHKGDELPKKHVYIEHNGDESPKENL